MFCEVVARVVGGAVPRPNQIRLSSQRLTRPAIFHCRGILQSDTFGLVGQSSLNKRTGLGQERAQRGLGAAGAAGAADEPVPLHTALRRRDMLRFAAGRCFRSVTGFARG